MILPTGKGRITPGRRQIERISRISRIIFAVFLLSALAWTSGAVPEDFGHNNAFPVNNHTMQDVIRWGPYITGTTSNHTNIHLWTSDPVLPTIQYANNSFRSDLLQPHRTAFFTDGYIHHTFLLENLADATRYEYRIWSGETEYGIYHFLTYPCSGPVTFVVYGDTRDELPRISQEERHRPVADVIAAEPGVSLVVHTGDLVNNGENMSDWDRFFATGAVMFANVTLVPVMGNHERNSDLYFEIFRTSPNYTVEAGNILIVVLDSNDWAWNDLPAQSAWMNESFSRDVPWKFVVLHHPIYSSEEKHPGGFQNLRREWEPVFRACGVIAVFQSHVHVYERDVAHGITYITEARGGAPFYTLAEQKIPEYRVSSENTLGYTVVRTENNSDFVHMRVMAVSPAGGKGESRASIIEEITLPEPVEWADDDSVDKNQRSLFPARLQTLQTCRDALFAGSGEACSGAEECRNLISSLFNPEEEDGHLLQTRDIPERIL